MKSKRERFLDVLDGYLPKQLGTNDVIRIADKAVEIFDDQQPRTELHALCERAIVALHMFRHAGINKAGFDECREGLCREWHRMMDGG